jgi:hypothetical protein
MSIHDLTSKAKQTIQKATTKTFNWELPNEAPRKSKNF